MFFVLAALYVPLLILCISIYTFFSAVIKDDFVSKAVSLSKQIAENIETRAVFFEKAAATNIQRYHIGNMLKDDTYNTGINKSLGNIKAFSYYVNDIYVYNTKGTVYSTSSLRFADLYEAVKDKFEDMSGNSRWLVVNQTIAAGEPQNLLYLVKVSDDSGELAGYMIITVSMDFITSLINDSKQPFLKDLICFLISSKRESFVIAGINKFNNDPLSVEDYLPVHNWCYTNNNRRLIVSNTLKTINVDLLLLLPLDIVAKQVGKMRLFFVSFSILFVISSFLASHIFIKSIIDPLARLLHKIKKYLE